MDSTLLLRRESSSLPSSGLLMRASERVWSLGDAPIRGESIDPAVLGRLGDAFALFGTSVADSLPLGTDPFSIESADPLGVNGDGVDGKGQLGVRVGPSRVAFGPVDAEPPVSCASGTPPATSIVLFSELRREAADRSALRLEDERPLCRAYSGSSKGDVGVAGIETALAGGSMFALPFRSCSLYTKLPSDPTPNKIGCSERFLRASASLASLLLHGGC